jgi:hypothetical protein
VYGDGWLLLRGALSAGDAKKMAALHGGTLENDAQHQQAHNRHYRSCPMPRPHTERGCPSVAFLITLFHDNRDQPWSRGF